MDLFCSLCFSLISTLSLLILRGASGATFTFINNCDYTVWPGILANSGSLTLETTGFELERGSSRVLEAPTGWSGRFWGRTGCKFDGSSPISCTTGDCGSGQVECLGTGAAPPATLAEFTLGTGSQDFYDVSLVDGYNLPMVVEGTGGAGVCATTGCVTDLNRRCPAELRVGDGDACKSACGAFGTPEYCCSGEYSTPATCRPSVYSEMFKSACPRSYSYAYDDATSTFTCTGADYTVTFCPSIGNSQKSSTDPTPTETTPVGSSAGAGTGTETVTGTSIGVGMNTGMGTGAVSSGSESQGEAMLTDASWLAGLASGDSTRTRTGSSAIAVTAAATASFMLLFLDL